MEIKAGIHTCLWFSGRALEAANFYTAIFPDSEVISVSSIAAGPAQDQAMVEFRIAGQQFSAFDGESGFEFSPAISFVVECRSQRDIDHFWEQLSRGGAKQMCGWVRDRFGISWQIVPEILPDLMARNPERVMAALLEMEKLEIGLLEAAAAGAG